MGKALEKGRINLGIHVPPEGMNFMEVREYADLAEQLGYNLFTVTDHFLNMRDPLDRTKGPLECWTTLAALAAVTKSIILAPLVSCANYRSPTLIAKMATTIDIISEGRFILGLGAGWLKDEFESFLGGFQTAKERLDGLEDAAIICREMFEKGISNYRGRKYSAYNAINSPMPPRHSIPIMIGAQGEKRALRIAVKHADIIHITGFPTVKIARHKIDVIKKLCERENREFKDLILGIGVWVMPEEDDEWINWRAKNLSEGKGIRESEALEFAKRSAGTENITSLLLEFHKLGIDLFTLPGLNRDQIVKIAEEVMPELW